MCWFSIQFTSPQFTSPEEENVTEHVHAHMLVRAKAGVCGSDKTQMQLAGNCNTLCENLKPLPHCWAQKGRVRKSAKHGGEGWGSRMKKLEVGVRSLATFRDAACRSNGGWRAQNTPCFDLRWSRVGQGDRKTQETGKGGGNYAPKVEKQDKGELGCPGRARVTFLVSSRNKPVSWKGEATGKGLRWGNAWWQRLHAERKDSGPRWPRCTLLSSRIPAVAAEDGAWDHSPRTATLPAPRPSPAPNTSMAHAAGP